VLVQYPAFMAAAAVVSPAQISRHVVREYERPCKLCEGSGKKYNMANSASEPCLGCDGKGQVLDQELSPPGAPQKAKWNECGACLKDEVLVWGGDRKPCWEPRP
jgi:DnaJ-class molecular chaperone